MKYLIVTYSDYKNLHGQNIRSFYYIQELIKRGHEVHLIVSRGANINEVSELFKKKIKIHKFFISTPRFTRFKMIRYSLFMFLADKYVEKVVRRINPDIIFAQNLLPGYPASKAAKKYNIPFVYDVFDFYHEMLLLKFGLSEDNIFFKILKNIEIGTMERAKLIVTVSDTFKKNIENLTKKKERKKKEVEVVYEGADITLFKPQEPNKRLLMKYNLKKKKVITFLGGIEKFDGLDILIDAAKTLSGEFNNAVFMIIGTGSYLPNIQQKIKECGLETYFIFTGWVNFNEVPSFLSVSDICVITLIKSHITDSVLTTKFYEFLASEKAVVIPNLSGFREIAVDNKNSLLFKCEDSASLAEAIRKLLNDDSLIKKLGKNGRTLILNEYSIQKLSKKLADITDRIIGV